MRKFMNNKGLLVVLSAVMAMTFTACGNDEVTEATDEVEVASMEEAEDLALNGPTELGEGETTFMMTVIYESGVGEDFIVNTDAETVGEALIENELIAGEDSEWGMMITSVRGVELDFDATGQYWAFYIDGEYAMTGVDATEVVDGAIYSFVVSE